MSSRKRYKFGKGCDQRQVVEGYNRRSGTEGKARREASTRRWKRKVDRTDELSREPSPCFRRLGKRATGGQLLVMVPEEGGADIVDSL